MYIFIYIYRRRDCVGYVFHGCSWIFMSFHIVFDVFIVFIVHIKNFTVWENHEKL